MSSSWITQWALNPTCPCKTQKRRSHREKRRGRCESRGRGLSDLGLRQEMPAATRSWWRQRTDSALEPRELLSSCNTVTWDFWSPEPSENQLLSFSATMSVVPFDGSHRKPTHLTNVLQPPGLSISAVTVGTQGQ